MKTIHTGLSLLWALLLTTGISNAQPTNNTTKNKEVTMATIQKNKEVIRKLYEEALNPKNMGVLPNFISDNYTGVQGGKGVAAFEAPIAALIKAFPDVHWQIESLIGEGDKVMVQWKLQGTHKAQFQQYAPTGKTVSNTGIGIYELKDGKIINAQVLTDRLGFLEALGLLPLNAASRGHKKDQVNFIDKFLIPAPAKKEFYERMAINRNLIKTLPGFITDAVYEYTDPNGNLVCITVAQWESREALNKAKEAVQASYKQEGFDTAEMFKRLNITADRGIYTAVEAN